MNSRLTDFPAFNICCNQKMGIKKMPAIEIAGLCLPLKPQKERGYLYGYSYSIFEFLKIMIEIKSDSCVQGRVASFIYCGNQHFH
jgi:hypothetical protein